MHSGLRAARNLPRASYPRLFAMGLRAARNGHQPAAGYPATR
ncbi:hypothetical protein NSU_1052 [Novosphingobium pentaromativorans US6-1]|uniref:Uncharacterized protein n=1 Tax=Novosphingobium pentaromativorans US6-1 TaxID=1088721 RepID=G6E9N1_9SPHN|nr:hypothetical protein NSU_1052 [Novosphingobium pentaromativorans US6-1]